MNWKNRYDGLKKGDRVKVIARRPHCITFCNSNGCPRYGTIGQVYSTDYDTERYGEPHVFVKQFPGGYGCSGFTKEDLVKVE